MTDETARPEGPADPDELVELVPDEPAPPTDPADVLDGLGTVLKRPLTWGAVLLAAGLGVVMTLSYLGGFLDPKGNLKGLKVGIVDEDRPVEVAGQRVDAGARIVRTVFAEPHPEIRWVVYRSRAAVLADLRDNRLSGAVAIPRSLSADLAEIGTTGGERAPAHLDLLANEGAGLFQTQVLALVSETLDQEVNRSANRDLVTVLGGLGLRVDPAGARSIGHPVDVRRTAVISNAGKTGRGLAPFYAAIMATLTGFLTANLASVTVDVLRGSEHLEVLGKELHLAHGKERPLVTWAAKSAIAVTGSALGGLLIGVTAVGVLGMQSAGWWKVSLLAALGATTIALIAMVFLTLFGVGGELVGVLFTTVFGVPSALGVYPVEALPAFFRFTSSWHPMHFLTDGMRSLVFYDGRSAAGLGRGVAVLATWWIAAALVGVLSAWAIGRRPSLRVGHRARRTADLGSAAGGGLAGGVIATIAIGEIPPDRPSAGPGPRTS